MMSLHINPYDFFTGNPAIDVPPSKNAASKHYAADQADGSCCNTESKERPKVRL